MRYLFFLFFSLPSLLVAQSTAESEVVATISQLFDGMRQADSMAVKAVFHPKARLMSVGSRDGEVRLGESPIQRFVSQIGSAPVGALDEQLTRTEIRVDGHLATAWTDYTFILNEKLSHCGVNSFQLAKLDGKWQIIQITDTRRREGCSTEMPDDVAGIHQLVDKWHKAAATANADAFFGAMTEDGIYIGTDASERWLRDELREWAKDAFKRESAWDFRPSNREIYFDTDHRTAWWEESLDTWMGPCRGSGIASRQEDGSWLIRHYHLSVTVPNEQIQDFLKLIEKK